MAESASPHSLTEPSPLTGPSSFGSVVDPQGLATVHEVPYHKVGYIEDDSPDNRLRSTRQPSAGSRDASCDSSMGQSYNEKSQEVTPRRLRHTGPTKADRDAWQQSETPSAQLRSASYRNTRTDSMSKPRSPKKDKKGGFRNTLRRMFSRRSTRDRISMPDSMVYPQNVRLIAGETCSSRKLNQVQDPEEFITSAADIPATRSASVPSDGFLRTSGLNLNPPYSKVPSSATNAPIPPPPPPPLPPPPPSQPERSPPERPVRPRRASVPSLTFSKQEMEAVESAMTGLGLQNAPERGVDAQDIGFAVTNGCNPNRRSRSVGAFRDSEHRMSPIQWRRFRRRSDEIRYWRQSTDLTATGLKDFDSPNMTQQDDVDVADDNTGDIDDTNRDFNFGLSGEPLPNQERIGLEERIVTLEIKLMDFEYALSKFQAGSITSSRRHSHPGETTKRQDSTENYFSDQPQASAEQSPALSLETPPTSPSKFAYDATPKQRPTSVATTMKPSNSGNTTTHRKDNSIDRSVRSSLASLTIDHYTTLITLIRHEQVARVRLEQQVSMLQRRLEQITSLSQPQSNANSISQHSHTRSLSSSQRRQGFVDIGDRGRGPIWQQRPRSSSYSTTETDTDDSTYHDVYVTPDITPVERGEYERGAFDRVAGVEEGVAF